MTYIDAPKFDPAGISWFTGRQLQEYDLPEERWLIKDVLSSRGRLLVYGDTGVHKSMVTLTLALSVVHGGTFLRKYSAKRGRVLYFGTHDMPLTDWQERFKRAAGEAANDQIMLIHADKNPAVNNIKVEEGTALPEWVKAAREFNPTLVIVDVVNETHTLPQNDLETPAAVMLAWESLFEDRPSFVFVHHEKKPPNDQEVRSDPYYGKHAFSGPQKWQDLCGTSMRVVKDLKTNRKWVELTKARHLSDDKKHPIPFHVDGESWLVDIGDDAWARAWDMMEAGMPPDEVAKRLAGRDMTLANATKKVAEIAEILEIRAADGGSP